MVSDFSTYSHNIMPQVFWIVSGNHFYQMGRKNHKQFTDFAAFKQEADFKYKSSYEVLKGPICRVYADVDAIPTQKPELIKQIIADLCTFFEVGPDEYAYTCNEGSHHGGLSYHVYIPRAIDRENLSRAIVKFRCDHPDYQTYIDTSVYSRDRLFRLPDQFGVEKDTETYKHTTDVHRIIKGTFEDCVVQNYEGLPMIQTVYNRINDATMQRCGVTKGFTSKNIFAKTQTPTTTESTYAYHYDAPDTRNVNDKPLTKPSGVHSDTDSTHNNSTNVNITVPQPQTSSTSPSVMTSVKDIIMMLMMAAMMYLLMKQ